MLPVGRAEPMSPVANVLKGSKADTGRRAALGGKRTLAEFLPHTPSGSSTRSSRVDHGLQITSLIGPLSPCNLLKIMDAGHGTPGK